MTSISPLRIWQGYILYSICWKWRSLCKKQEYLRCLTGISSILIIGHHVFCLPCIILGQQIFHGGTRIKWFFLCYSFILHRQILYLCAVNLCLPPLNICSPPVNLCSPPLNINIHVAKIHFLSIPPNNYPDLNTKTNTMFTITNHIVLNRKVAKKSARQISIKNSF